MNRRSFLFFASATGVLSARPGGLQQALEIPPPRRNSAPALGPLCRGAPIRRISATQPTQTALPGNAIPKYVDPLPTFAGRRISAANIKVSIAELLQQVLPASLYASLPAPYREGTLVWGYKVGGAPPHYPGFTIEARSGTPPVVTHLHGAAVPSVFDGNPDAWFTPGSEITGPAFATSRYKYPNAQEATTLWFHDHALGMTRINVYAGWPRFT